MASIKGPTWATLPLITLPGFGVAIVWSTEMAFASPYLLSLGLSKSMMTLVFISAPLSGFVVQPVIGQIADKSTSKYGRRRPFMLFGCLVSVISFLLLGFTSRFADLFIAGPSQSNDTLTQLLAVFAVYSVNFAVNVVMVANKTIIIDLLAGDQQGSANAWAARMGGIGSVCGYFVGQVDLVRIFPYLGHTQLQVLSILGGIVLLTTQGVTMICVQEVPLEASDQRPDTSAEKGMLRSLRAIISLAKIFPTLPKPIRQLCWIQFFSWIGWFPAAFFTTTWIGELYRKDHPIESGGTSHNMDAEATRYGSLAMFWSSILSLAVLLTLPRFIAPSKKASDHRHADSLLEWIRYSLNHRPDLATVYAATHLWFGLLFMVTWFWSKAIVVFLIYVALGPCLASRDWVAGALLGEMIKEGTLVDHHGEHRTRPVPVTEHGSGDNHESLLSDGDDEERLIETSRLLPSSDPDASASGKRTDGRDTVGDQGGTIVGIMNTFICLPQFVMIALSSILFAILEPGRSVTGGGAPPNSDKRGVTEGVASRGQHIDTLGLIFRIGGLSAFVACYLTVNLARGR
ncbi:hypothetical protein FRB94_002276 [Tulasnella sp. JGI-2019a]|nr:hypothetical protein FRB93_004086 [Tulasnella sp. JGI-2019a]KAG9004600.1 hypothetical protein FRB94_002276 [Tulasnella sp. JGI-2019a]KAG9031158.1 hypothetical protein FRB95_003132 [Tulasnella sp. JGI-2019a]